jgi:ditrans,polycis-polyprenyl diphosphate synthase
MDGNRRYARKKNKPLQQGHADGSSPSEGCVARELFVYYLQVLTALNQSIQKMLDICLRLRVRCVTVYAFSIENFKRSKKKSMR